MPVENEIDLESVLDYRKRYRGLIGIRSKVPLKDASMLSLLYTPGVAAASREVAKDPAKSFQYTCRGNTVALISDGSSVFGLGNVGPEAALPALEGKAIIFKTFAGIDALPLAIKAGTTEELVEAVIALGPTFGAICLEDIEAPRSMLVAAMLEQAMDIPVLNNHQHSVAVGAVAALINAAKVAGKELEKLRVVINGSGAAATGTVELLLEAGVKDIIVCDRWGAIYPYRPHHMNWAKWHLAKRTNPECRCGSLEEVLEGADAFIGYATGTKLTPDMIRKMAPDPIIFAFALPEPEILPPTAQEAGAKVVATALSNYPNGINIALVFPGLFRGLLDVQARNINITILMEAARCLASLVPEDELRPDHILPDVLDFWVAPTLAEAVARAAIETGEARNPQDPHQIYEWTLRYVYEGQAVLVPEPEVGPDAPLSEQALDLRRRYKGALEIAAKLPIRDHYTLNMYLSPADSYPAFIIKDDMDKVYDLTVKGNLVAVVSDGSAVLGLGNIGARAALPVMEGKSILFHTFAGVEAFPICVATQDPDEIVAIVERLAPTFGGINLEDISAPRCFEIERKLRERLDIPVFHDDQHGTAVVTLAALYNALKLVGKDIGEIRVVINGAGAAGIAVAKILLAAGAGDIILCDTKGIIYPGRKRGMNWAKEEIARQTNKEGRKGTLDDALPGSDVFIGVSGPGVLTPERVAKMNPNAIIFAMANPDTEFAPRPGASRRELLEAMKAAREAGAVIIATGRSDFPNQVNNSLGFPGIFRGALDARAREINEAMKMAAAKALASLVSDEELRPDYILPTGMDFRVAPAVAAAVAQAAVETGVARVEVDPKEVEERTLRFIYEGYLARK
ncbi:MAG TPA: NADP-dependent malic enzyme [Chloroflexi bacterium]|nr:NADP-dependent malic enzyme [Chloroflexota bacterium]